MHVKWIDKNTLYFLDYSKEPSTSVTARLVRHSQPRDLKGQTISGFVETPFREKEFRELVFFHFSLLSFQFTEFCLYSGVMSFTLPVI